MLAKKLKQEIETLPAEGLREVEYLVKILKVKKGIKEVHREKPYNVFDDILDSAADTGVRDLARNHDHYLYGAEKR